jgi:hypothetical protein
MININNDDDILSSSMEAVPVISEILLLADIFSIIDKSDK